MSDRRNITNYLFVLDHGRIWKINTGKSIVTLGTLFFRSCSENHFSIKYNAYVFRIVIRRINKAVQKIRFGICHIHIDRLLCSCNDDRLRRILNHIRKCRCRISKSIGSMTDHKAIVTVISFFYRLYDKLPMFRCHIRTVYIAHLKRFHLAYLLHLRNIRQNVLRCQSRSQPVFRLSGRNRSSGSNHKYFLHSRILSLSILPLLSEKSPTTKRMGFCYNFSIKKFPREINCFWDFTCFCDRINTVCTNEGGAGYETKN